jgi:HEAT repeat protein
MTTTHDWHDTVLNDNELVKSPSRKENIMLRCRRFLGSVLVTIAITRSFPVALYASEGDPLYKGKPVSEWILMLDSSEPDAIATQANAERVLGNVGAPAIPQLVLALKHRKEGVRAAAARILGRMQMLAKPAIPALLDGLQDKSEQVRRASGLALCNMKDVIGPDSVPALTKALEHKDLRVRALAACVLTHVHYKAIQGMQSHLFGVVKEMDADVRTQALTALGNMGRPAQDALPVLRDTLKSAADPDTRFELVGAIVTIDPNSATTIDLLIKVLQEKDPHSWDRGAFRRSLAAHHLGRIGPAAKAAVEPLTDALRDPGAILRAGAASALSRITPAKTPEMVRVLIPLLKDKDVIVRGEAARARALMGVKAKEAIEPLIDAIKSDDNPHVRNIAANALTEIDPEAAKRAGVKRENRNENGRGNEEKKR